MDGLDAIDAGYRAIYERAVALGQADERMASVAIGGSVASGTADAWSDLDLEIVATEEHYDALLADWPTWLEDITPTVFARTPILPFIINTVTTDGLTVDLVVFKGEPFHFPPAHEYTVGMLSGVRFADVDDALEYAVAEQLRGLAGPFISLLQRDEHVRHLAGVPHLLGLLTTVFLAEQHAPPLGKHWNEGLTLEQRSAVEALPAVKASRDSLLAFGLATAELLVTRARPMFAERDIPWPSELAAVVQRRLASMLAIDTASWLF